MSRSILELVRTHFQKFMKHITREGLKKMIDGGADLILLCVLSKESFAKRHIPGSINIPWQELTLKESEAKLPKEKSVVVYCSSFECDASTKGATVLELLGYKVIEFDGGVEDWQAAGYNLEGS